MRVQGKPMRSVWVEPDGWSVRIIDQTRLPHDFVTVRLTTIDAAAHAIRAMQVRGAPLIGATAAYGLCLAARADPSDAGIERAAEVLLATRPTAINLRWAIERMLACLRNGPREDRVAASYAEAAALCDEDVATNAAIGRHGLGLIRDRCAAHPDRPVQVLTHCNAGWLATVDWGTALAPIYMAHDAGIPVHVWVDETRPRNQGALTAWELAAHGVPHTLIADNTGGHLMQTGRVDLCLVGTDRTTAAGDVANKIGTYLKALAAHDNGVPFYVALPSTTIDWSIADGLADIPIETRAADEVLSIRGRASGGEVQAIAIAPPGTDALNPAFDVTPARLVTGLVTERGRCAASRDGLETLFPERSPASGKAG